MKLLLDYVLSALALLLCIPLLLYIVLRLRVSGNGSVFYMQERLGRGGRPFQLLKFRTMVPDAEPCGPCLAVPGDERATSFGRTLRKYHLDELPQLWNVLRGDMSLVGPRPEREFFARQVEARLPEYGKLYELRRSSNMVAGHEIQFANMGMDVIKKAVIAQLKAGHPAWFACDCDPFSLRRMGVFDRKSVNVEALFDVEYKLDKADRLRFGESLGNHAMTIQGVDLDENGNPTRWKIENSWGKMVGENGYFVMSDEWFSDFVYDVVLRREFLDADTLAVANSKPVELEPWDPFCKATRCIA